MAISENIGQIRIFIKKVEKWYPTMTHMLKNDEIETTNIVIFSKKFVFVNNARSFLAFRLQIW